MCALSLVACGAHAQGSVTASVDAASGVASIVCDDASATSGAACDPSVFTLDDDQVLVVDSDIVSGAVSVKLTDAAGVVAFEERMSEDASGAHDIGGGAYTVSVSVEEDGTSGKVTLVPVDRAEYDASDGDVEAALLESLRWTPADNADDAARLAGVNTFRVPDGDELSTGTVVMERFRYGDSIASAIGHVGSAEIDIRRCASDEIELGFPTKGLDLSWDVDAGGVPVSCFGRDEGQAIVATWRDGDAVMAVRVTGYGEAADFGLTTDDVRTIVGSMSGAAGPMDGAKTSVG